MESACRIRTTDSRAKVAGRCLATDGKGTPVMRRIPARFTKGERKYHTGASGSYIARRELTVSEGVDRVLRQLEHMIGYAERRNVVISTNVRTRLDGLPRSGERKPEDPGAAVYWEDPFNRTPRVMAIDQYDEVADNLAAIAATLEAMRAIERHGGATILERAFTGFTALPNPDKARTWRDVLGYQPHENPTLVDVKTRYRVLSQTRHPDRAGGSHDAMAEINVAYEQAQKAVGP
jgi:hypothetical protein